jgi:hypothetical protein
MTISEYQKGHIWATNLIMKRIYRIVNVGKKEALLFQEPLVVFLCFLLSKSIYYNPDSNIKIYATSIISQPRD